MNWLKKLFSKRVEVREVKFTWTGMDLLTWRSSPHRLAFARELWQNPEWREALSAVRNAQPYGYPIRGNKITKTQAILELGRKEGYQDCLNALFSLPVAAPLPVTDIQADYDPKDYSLKAVEE